MSVERTKELSPQLETPAGETVTLELLRKSRQRVTLKFSANLEITLSQSDGRLARFTEGADYLTEDIKRLIRELALEKAERLMADKLTRYPCSLGQAKKFLYDKGFDIEISEAVVEKFVGHGWLDDQKFGRAVIELTMAQRPAGLRSLIATLVKKLVPQELASEMVADSFADLDETELAVRLLQKRWWRLRELDLDTARQKGYTLLARKSIGYDAGKAAFDRLAAEEPLFAE